MSEEVEETKPPKSQRLALGTLPLTLLDLHIAVTLRSNLQLAPSPCVTS